MLEKIGHVRNPLTVIAIFAGLAEVSGTVVLPFLNSATQDIYVWFLMLFPAGLISLFFGTLFFRHHVLYAPSDFRSDDGFTNLFQSARADIVIREKKEELTAVAPPEAADQPREQSEEPDNYGAAPALEPSIEHMPALSDVTEHTNSPNNLASAFIVQDWLTRKIEAALGSVFEFRRNMSLRAAPDFVFDGIATAPNNRTYLLETRYVGDALPDLKVIRRTFDRVLNVYYAMGADERREFTFIFAVGHNGFNSRQCRQLEFRVRELSTRYPFHFAFKHYDIRELFESSEAA